MNTKQMIVLWYGGLALISVFIAYAISEESVLTLIPVILVLVGLSIYTFRDHPKVNKRSVLKWVSLPIGIPLAIIVLLAGVGSIIETTKDKPKPVSKSRSFLDNLTPADSDHIRRLGPKSLTRENRIQIPIIHVDIVDVKMDWVGTQYGLNRSQTRWHTNIAGWVRNRSDKILNGFTIHVEITDSSGQRQTSSNSTQPNTLSVPPSETRRFETILYNLDKPDRKGWEASYEVTDAWSKSK
jgi:hypothetical protein